MSSSEYFKKVCIVTGAASGIGRAFCRELLQSGAIVVGSDVQEDALRTLQSDLNNENFTTKVCNVTSEREVKELIDATVEQHGRLDIMFNNAGIGVIGEIAEYTVADWKKTMDVNFNGVVFGCHYAYQQMRKQGYGQIVNTSSMAGLMAFPWMGAYTASKFAVSGLTRVLASEAKKYGVTATLVCPGVIKTPILHGGVHGKLHGYQAGAMEKFADQLKGITPEEFARKALIGVAQKRLVVIEPFKFKMIWWAFKFLPFGLADRLMVKEQKKNRALVKSFQAR